MRTSAARRRPRPLAFDATHRLGGGAADDPDIALGELDGEGGAGDQHRDGLVFVDAAEGDLLPDDHDHAGVAGPALHPDWFGGGAWRGPSWAGATQPFDLLRGEGVLAGAEQLAGGQVAEHQRGGLDPDADPAPPRISAAS